MLLTALVGTQTPIPFLKGKEVYELKVDNESTFGLTAETELTNVGIWASVVVVAYCAVGSMKLTLDMQKSRLITLVL